jgi:hypothetical protein
VKGYRSCSFDGKTGSQFHHGDVSLSPPIIPDGRLSQVRFETLAFPPRAFPASAEFKRWYAYVLPFMVCPQPRLKSSQGLIPALCPRAPPVLRPPSVLSPFATASAQLSPGRRCTPPRRALPLLHRSYGLMRQSHPSLLSFGHTSFEKSSQVVSSPCCEWDLPDVISANPS